jgi:osmotically-inducible protein OsmY
VTGKGNSDSSPRWGWGPRTPASDACERANETEHIYLAEHIRDALARDERVGELGVEVTLTPAGVFLTGEVASPQRRDAIGDVVHEIAPDQEIHNQTTVMQYSEPGQEEQL